MSHWYCPVCKDRKEPEKVTYQETCADCGEYVKWIESDNPIEQLDKLIKEELMARCEGIRKKTGKLVSANITIYVFKDGKIEIEYGCYNDPDYSDDFPTLPALIDHMDKLIKE